MTSAGGSTAGAARRAWQALRARGPTRAALIRFHTVNKMLLLAHSEATYRRMGPLIASPHDVDATARAYGELLDEALARTPSRGAHVNVLQHLAGMLRGLVEEDEHRAIRDAIDRYAAGQLALGAVQRRLHAASRDRSRYVHEQTYLAPPGAAEDATDEAPAGGITS